MVFVYGQFLYAFSFDAAGCSDVVLVEVREESLFLASVYSRKTRRF